MFGLRKRIKLLSSSLLVLVGTSLLLFSCSSSQNLIAGTPTLEEPDRSSLPVSALDEKSTQSAVGSARFSQYIKFQKLTVDQGLSQNTVTSIVEDSFGFLWFGTRDGLNRYDGYTVKVYKYDPADPTSISNNAIRDLFVDREGILWVATEDGLNQFDNKKDQFTRYHNDPDILTSLGHNILSVIFEDSAGQLWIGTQGGGLNLFDRQSNQFIKFINNPALPASLSSNIVWDIAEDSSGRLWIATRTGLDLFIRERGEFLHFRNDPQNLQSLPDNDVRALLFDNDEKLWIGTYGGGLTKFSPLSQRFKNYSFDPEDPYSLSDDEVRTVFRDHEGVLWIGTSSGFNQYREESDDFIRYVAGEDGASLSNSTVLDIYQDRSGVYWIATSGGGLNYFDHSLHRFTHIFRHPDQKNTLSANHVSALMEDRDGVLWIGTERGLNRYFPISDSFDHYFHNPRNPESLTSDSITALFQDRGGKIWAGTDQGLNVYDPQRDQFLPYETNRRRSPGNFGELPSIDLSKVPINTIVEDDRGLLWLGSDGEGLIRLNPDENRVIVYPSGQNTIESLYGKTVLSLMADHEGILWLGTLRGGLSKFDPSMEQFTHYLSNPADSTSLSDNTVNAILEDQTGFLWVGTSAGLNKLDIRTGRITQFREKDGLPNDFVNGIVEDELGFIWISTNNGLSRLDPDKTVFKNFSPRDGLQSNQFNQGAYIKSANGDLLFGGVSGLNIIKPDQIDENPYLPPVIFTKLTQGGENIDIEMTPEFVQQITLSWPQNYFEFEFVTLNYVQPDKNQYAYRLEGLDQDWIYIGNRRYGRYTNLPGGDYTLHITGSNNDGLWNENGSSILVTVLPPFWETRWFQVTIIFIITSGVFLGYRLRMHNINVRNEQLSTQIEERTRELEQRRQVAEGLREVLVLLNSDRSLDESLQFILCQIINLTGADNACLFQHHFGIVQQLIGVNAPKNVGDPPCIENGNLTTIYPKELFPWLAEKVRYSPEPVITDPHSFYHFHPDPQVSSLREIGAIVVIPVSLRDEYLTALTVMFSEEKTLSTEEIGLISTFADQASLAIGNAKLRSQSEEIAIVTERNRLARDLHDAVTQTLFSASLIAEAIPEIWIINRAEGQSLLNELRELNHSALSEMRALLMELRPATLEESSLPDLLIQLRDLIAGRTDMNVDVQIDGQFTIPSEAKISLYRIAQEASTNIVKHAAANHAILRLTNQLCLIDHLRDENHDCIMLEIEDDGRGFDPKSIPTERFGIANIQERARAIGAQVIIISRPDRGTQIQVFWEREAKSDG